MSYLALYRRFRPVTFDQMIGQEHIVRTLTNQIQSGRIGHAYLFCGTRGTGKTTAAKIFARAINCEHPVNGSPCSECETCKALSDPANLDIVEMDAASNNKVENIREIRDKVQYPPVAGRYKVYIIDEVHMLTPEAFNALLKTLEEPPAHAVFILATTEQHKLPSTILSRCMRFDFKLIPDELIVSLIERIYDELGKEYEKEAVVKIARSGEGCVRDALSVADLCLSFSDKKLTYNDVIDVLGASDNKKTYELLEGVFDCLPDKALSVTEEMCASGKSVGLTCKEVQGVLREVLIAKTCGDYKKVLSLPDSELNTIKSLADRIDEHRMLRILEIFSAVENDLKYSTHPRVVFETAVLKSTLPCEDYNVDALIGRIERLEKQLKQIEENGVKVPLSVDYRQISPQREAIKGGLKPETGAATAELVDDARAENAAPLYDDDDLPPFDIGDAPSGHADAYPHNDQARQSDERDKAPYAPISEHERRKSEINGFFDGLTPPTDDDLPPFDMGDGTLRSEADGEKTTFKVSAQTALPAPATPVAPVNEARVWGKVVRKLRADKNIMLWIACQDAEPKLSGDKLIIVVDGDNEYNLLIKPDSVRILQEAVSAECDLKVAVAKRGEQARDDFEDDIKRAAEILGDTEISE